MADSIRNDRRRKVASDNDDVTVLESTTAKRRKSAVAEVRNDEEAGLQQSSSEGVIVPEPVIPSPEVMALRQLVINLKKQGLTLENQLADSAQLLLDSDKRAAKKEEMYQRICEVAREAELRAERAEKLLGSKRGGNENKEKELEERVADLTNQLKEEREKRQQAKERKKELKNQLEEERNERRKANERIDELKRKLAEYENSPMEKQISAVVGKTVVHLSPPPPNNNLLALVCPSYAKSISFDEALSVVRRGFEKCGEKGLMKSKKKVAEYDCEVCEAKLHGNLAVIKHFLSKEHIEKVRPLHARVPSYAYNLWVQRLYKAAKKSRKENR